MHHRNTVGPSHRMLAALLLCAMAFVATPARSQAPDGLTGVWEPVNYPEDLSLTDVFFVTPEIGYVAGQGATILKTIDGGANWNVLLGGDPGSQEREILDLRFVNETHGWATHRAGTDISLLRTTDGETWEPVGTIPDHYNDYIFTTETEGVVAASDRIYRTIDAGATWKQVGQCQVRAAVDGLTRAMQCEIERMHFPSPATGFAIAYVSGDLSAILKTTDGGNSWHLAGLLTGDRAREGGIFFTDENNGVARTSTGKAWSTADGGQTWKALIATTLGPSIRFADPEVGWSFARLCIGMGCENARLSYTADGGRRWTSRSFPFPAGVEAFSLPRRDMGYAVGNHGMIYRYRVVPKGTPAAANSIEAVAMPPIAGSVIEQLAALESGLETMQAAFEATEWPAEGDVADWQMEDADSWVEANFSEFDEFEQSVDSVSTGLPELGRRHRNLNLVIEGLRLLGDLTGQGSGLKQTFESLRHANDPETVSAALLQMSSQLEASKASVEVFQSMHTTN